MFNEAIILAGGVGTRLKDVVADKPKPMALINDKPFLEYLLNYLSKYGITHVILSVGYKSEQILNYFENKYHNLEISYAIENQPLGTGGGIRLALQKSKTENVFIVNGDTLFNIDLQKISNFHNQNNADLTIALNKVTDGSRYGTILVDNTNKIISFEEKKKLTQNALINGGTYLLSKKIFSEKYFPAKFSFEKDFMEKYYQTNNFYGILFNDYFIDIGIPETYKKAQTDFLDEFGF